jgi:hypothetical protein
MTLLRVLLLALVVLIILSCPLLADVTNQIVASNGVPVSIVNERKASEGAMWIIRILIALTSFLVSLFVDRDR